MIQHPGGHWDLLEKTLAELGLDWELIRSAELFWLDLGWARVGVVDHDDHAFYRVSQKNAHSAGRLLQWDCRNIESLTALLNLLWAR